VCRSGSCVDGKCSSACTEDGACPQGDFCDAGRCKLRLPNGDACGRDAQCASDVCNADGKCGDPDGADCSNARTCRSGACASGKCGAGCGADRDCQEAAYCAAGSCVPDLDNGERCERAAQCLANVCETDGKCGEPLGKPCARPSVCRSRICDATGTCTEACATDADCAAGTWCEASSHTCQPSADNGKKPKDTDCDRGPQCLSGVCNGDGACGSVNGEVCGTGTVCRSQVCDNTNATCGYLNANGPCKADSAATVCQSGACDTDALCGYTNGSGPCSSDAQCRSAQCEGETQKCGGVQDAGVVDAGAKPRVQLRGGGLRCAAAPGAGGSEPFALLGLCAALVVAGLRRRRAR
jgi:hypothetical protein